MSLDNNQNQAAEPEKQPQAEPEQTPEKEVAATAVTADAPVASKEKKEKKALTPAQKKKRIRRIVIEPCMILVAACIRSVCVRLFMT